MPGDRVAGVVLAAGRSRRMGTSKPLLEADGVTFIERTVGLLLAAECFPVLAVVRAGDPEEGLAQRAGARPVINHETDSEQIESLRLALHTLETEDVGAAAVLPVDHPLVEPGTVRALIAGWHAAPDRIVRPVHDGRPGHPTVFPRSVWPSLMAAQAHGARSVVEDGAHAREDVAVADAGVVADIDTPDAFSRLVEGR